ncbi:zinc knuckle CX2CX4HX4C containing protein [Tanacetum coccineum]
MVSPKNVKVSDEIYFDVIDAKHYDNDDVNMNNDDGTKNYISTKHKYGKNLRAGRRVTFESDNTTRGKTTGKTNDELKIDSTTKRFLEEVNGRVDNTLYEYFIGKRLSFPILENYVWNDWSKLVFRMMNKKGFIFLEFAMKKRLEDVFETGPWMIRNSPIILKSRGCNSYVRTMIELNFEKELVNNLMVSIPLIEEEGYTKETIHVEHVGGVLLNKPKSRYFYRPKVNAKKVDDANATKKDNINKAPTFKAGAKKKQIVLATNSFCVLSGGDCDNGIWNDKNAHDFVAMKSEDECEHAYDKTGTFMKPNKESGKSEGERAHIEEVKSEVQRNRNEFVCDMDNIEHKDLAIPNACVKHYELFLGVKSATTPLDIPNLFTKDMSTDVHDYMVHLITNDEIKKAMFSIGDNSVRFCKFRSHLGDLIYFSFYLIDFAESHKSDFGGVTNRAPRPNGYSSAFFKKG